MMLVEEAEEKLLAESSKKADEAKEVKAQKEWAKLRREEEVRGALAEAPVLRCRSLMADRNREMLEATGELVGQEQRDECQAVKLV
jgi:hypothetical protein